MAHNVVRAYRLALDALETPDEPTRAAMMDEARAHLAAALGVRSHEILYIGDGIVDYMTADASGASFIGVETGPNSAEMWRRKVGKDVRTIPSVASLAEMI